MEIERNLIGVDRRGGQGYQEVPCEICGGSFFISKNAESGICARCVVMGYPKSKAPNVNPFELWGSIEKRRARKYRKENGISQDQAAQVLGMTRKTYRDVENGKISRVIRRKVEQELARAERGQ